MDQVLQRSMEPVLRDLVAAGIELPVIEDHDWASDPEMSTAMLRSPDGPAIGVSVSRSATIVDQVVQVADQVQDGPSRSCGRGSHALASVPAAPGPPPAAGELT